MPTVTNQWIAGGGMLVFTSLILGKLATEFFLPLAGRKPIVLLSHRRSMQAAQAIIWITLALVLVSSILELP